MNVQWDYSKLAQSYQFRPDYSEDALENFFNAISLDDSASICDVGAGTGHFTIHLLKKNWVIDAVEPNDSMRAIGEKRIIHPRVKWYKGTGEHTGRNSIQYDLVSFGSSFNVVNQSLALEESHRILKDQGWFACMWNHRDLEDPLQKKVEEIIASYISGYDYGKRRINPTLEIEASNYFDQVKYIGNKKVYLLDKYNWVQAWRSHATLERQAGNNFEKIITEIESYLNSYDSQVTIKVPYITKIWFAKKTTK